MTSTSNCLNCYQPLDEASKFCKVCGQQAAIHRLSIGHLVHEVFHFFTHADKGIIYLVKRLAAEPGVVAREYITGKRKAIGSPLSFFLIAVGLFLFVQTSYHPLAGGADMTLVKKEVMKIPDQTVRERRLLKLERSERSINFMAKNSNIINFVLTPLIALIFFLFFIKAGYNYAEHIIANLFFAGFTALVFVFIITPYLVATKNTGYYYFGIMAFLLIEVIYRSVGYYQLMNRKTFRSKLYCVLISVFYMTLWSLASTSAIRWYINTGFNFK